MNRSPLAYAVLKRIYVYDGSDHKHEAQSPIPIVVGDKLCC